MNAWKVSMGVLALLAVAGVGWSTLRSPVPATVPGWAAPGGLTVLDRGSGRPIPDAVWTLVAVRAGGYEEGLGQGVVPAAPSAALVAQARSIAIGAYGYEVASFGLDAFEAMHGRVALEPVTEMAHLSLATDDDAVAACEVTLMISLRDPDAPASAAPVWWLHRDLTLSRAGTAVPVGRGHRMQALPMRGGDAHVSWPVPAAVTAGRRTVVHVERTRRLALEPPSGSRGGGAHLGWLHVDPRHVGALGDDRRSGLAMHAGTDGYEADPTTAGLVFAGVPRVPLTGVARTSGGWFAVELDADSSALPLSVDAAPRKRLGSIAIDGEPPPEGTVILPGTVADDLVNAILARGWLELDGLGVRTPKPESWQETRLPAAASLTAWHRERGLARLQWAESGVAAGTWEPGSVALRRHPACRMRAAVSIRSGCVGSPRVSSGSSRADGMERPFASTSVSVLGGVPFGPVAVEFRTWSAGATEPVVMRRQVVLDPASPCARFALAEDGGVAFEGAGPVPASDR